MKANKLFKKLALSGVAVGAAAVTLTATTFAWYTQNNEVKIGEVSAMTSAESDSGSIYVSAANDYNATTGIPTGWTQPGSSVTPTPVTLQTGKTRVMAPVSYTDAVKTGDTGTKTAEAYLPLTGSAKSANTEPKNDNAVYGSFGQENILQYRLRLRTATAGTATPIYLSSFNLTLTNVAATPAEITTTAGLPTVVAVATAGGAAENTDMGADLRKALKMTVTQYNYVEPHTDQNDATVDANGYSKTAASTDVYSFDAYTNIADEGLSGSIDSLAYYNAVLGTALSRPTLPTAVALQTPRTDISGDNALTTSTALKFLEIPATGYVEVVVTFWLDGWDEYCFDCMRKQGFKCSMNFTSAVQEARVPKASA